MKQHHVFPSCFLHLQSGGHVRSLHIAREKKHFAKIDLENFYYTISRNRVARSLRDVGKIGSGALARWSCVKNPFGNPAYALPYGFVQSPILASLVLSHSTVGEFVRELENGQNSAEVLVYMDDFLIASDSAKDVEDVALELRERILAANFSINERKSRSVSDQMEVFNCDLSAGVSRVTEQRRRDFALHPRNAASVEGFDNYCRIVES